MGRKLVQASLRGLSLVQVRHLSTVGFGEAVGDTSRVYREVERDFGVLAPPVALHAPVPELLSASWVLLRETMLVDGLASRTDKEAVAAAVSVSNQCPFCDRMHSAVFDSLAARPGSRSGRRAAPAADRTDGLAAWAASGGPAPFPAGQLPELVGTALCLHYLNRMVNIFLGSEPLPPNAPNRALGPVVRVLVGLIRGSMRAKSEPGASLTLLPAAPLPPDLSWAAGEPRIAEALARTSAAVERTGEDLVPAGVRALVAEVLARWDGRDPGLGRAWLDGPLDGLPASERSAGTLALLTALASYRVDDTVVGAFRRDHPGDRELLALTSWVSLRAARHRCRQESPELPDH
ncbi:hypothetical protein ACIQGZ_23085 [Streptomyces sp. NPDC092296]|uniref:hypothetical protein n=1 Tax=Streptomyces sp. NPDC092296 TaxID=3366012 RepID=UPI00381A94AA